MWLTLALTSEIARNLTASGILTECLALQVYLSDPDMRKTCINQKQM